MRTRSSCFLQVTLALFVLLGSCTVQAAAAEDAPQGGILAPSFKQQPLFERINVAEAWKITQGDAGVLIGVVDNGFDFYHPDLKGQVLPGYYFSGGYHSEVFENMAHGTMVASILVAARRSEGGMVGLAPGCRALTASQGTLEHAILRLQREFIQAHPKATPADWQKEMSRNAEALTSFGEAWVRYQFAGSAETIRYLVDHGVRVINISGAMWRSACPDEATWRALEAAFAYAAEKNVVLVLGAGNDAAERDDYPGSAETVLIVGATMLDDTRWEQVYDTGGGGIKQGSSYGRRLSVMAPAENVVVCQPHEARFYTSDDGPVGPVKIKFDGPYATRPAGATSCATPVVAALVALVRSARPDLDAKSVVTLVEQGCDDLGDPGFDTMTGHGRVNFGRSLQLALRWADR